ncbi:MAG: carboxypeptidase-like regulatory domain-containing protein [Bacteroidota bacterium]
MKKSLFPVLLVTTFLSIYAREPITQSIRGTVIDAVTGFTLVGANVVLLNSETVVGTSTDQNGNFILGPVPLGRQSIEVSFVGYATLVVPGLFVSGGMETQVQVQMEETSTEMEELVVRSVKRKEKAQNDMAEVSSRTFSVEETERFAGSLGDPAKMVANYAGVMTHNDSRNDIIIRGNSPIGVLWRLEGVEVPNPNHFSALGTTGGPVSMVNNNLLRDSDFLTGAFPAEFGNATAGIFDLNLRSGNTGAHEFLGQIGFNGFELGAEGPLFKVGETQKASYLANFRYSTYGLMNDLGINFGTGTAVPGYMDLTFMVDIPGTRLGRWKLFGLWGKSSIEMGREPGDTTATSYNPRGTATDFGSGLGVLGLSNTYFFNPKSSLKTTFSCQQTHSYTILDSLIDNASIVKPMYRQTGQENKLSLATQFRQKVNSRNDYRLGFVADYFFVHHIDSAYVSDYNKFITTADFTGNLGLARIYGQWHHAFGNKLNGYAGMHFQYFSQNGEISCEPRLSMTWQPGTNGTFSLGYGLHSQLQPKAVYVAQSYDEATDTYSATNGDLGYTKSHHAVLGYNHMLGKNFRVKAESYYQYLFHIPVSDAFPEYSLINSGDFFGVGAVDSMENKGTGYNYGIELTVEKFLSKDYYILFTSSLFDSKYRAADGILRNTAFNGNYVFNLLGGYERRIGRKTYLTLDLKGVLAGGRRYVPIDLEASIEEGMDVRDWSRAYEERFDDYFRTDLRIGVKLNSRNYSMEWAIDFQNLTGYQSIFMEVFDAEKEEVYQIYQQGFYPMVLYRIHF